MEARLTVRLPAVVLAVLATQGCGYSGPDSEPFSPPPPPTPYVITFDYKVFDPATQAVYATGCTAMDSVYGRMHSQNISATLPLGAEYEVDYVVHRAVGTLAGELDASYFCGLSQKEPANHIAPACYETIPNSGAELSSVTIADSSGKAKEIAAGVYTVMGAAGDVEKYRLISRKAGPVAVYCQRGPCGGAEFSCGLLTVVAK